MFHKLMISTTGEDTIVADIFKYYTISDETLPTPNAEQIGGYDNNTNLIWILGGMNCEICVYSYNITSDTINTHNSLTTGITNNNPSNSVIINSIIYYLDEDGTIGKYEIEAETQIHPWFNDPSDVRVGCLVTNTNKTKLYLIDDVNEFFIIDIKNETINQGPNANFDRTSPACAVSSDNYMYVLFGNQYEIERINLNGIIYENSWQILALNLNVPKLLNYIQCDSMNEFNHLKGLLINDIIYVFGFWCGAEATTEGAIFKFDPKFPSIEYVAKMYNSGSYRGLISYVNTPKMKKVYFFGGWPDQSSTDVIYYSNEFVFDTLMSTTPITISSSSPTNTPSDYTGDTSTSTTQPTSIPTIHPSNSTYSNSPSCSPTEKLQSLSTTPSPTFVSTLTTTRSNEATATVASISTANDAQITTAVMTTKTPAINYNTSSMSHGNLNSDEDAVISENNENINRSISMEYMAIIGGMIMLLFCLLLLIICFCFNRLTHEMKLLKLDLSRINNDDTNMIEKQPLKQDIEMEMAQNIEIKKVPQPGLIVNENNNLNGVKVVCIDGDDCKIKFGDQNLEEGVKATQ